MAYSTNFPFIGCTLDIISSHDAVRYRGRLHAVDVEERYVVLTHVTHFGSEDRHVHNVESKPAKGELPQHEQRKFYSEFIHGYRVIDGDDGGDGGSVLGRDEADAVSVVAPSSIGPSASLLAKRVGNNSAGRGKAGNGLIARGGAMDSDDDTEKVASATVTADLGSLSISRSDLTTTIPASAVIDPATHPGPLYFIAQIQHQQERAIGICINSPQHPDAPVYMAIPLANCGSTPAGLCQLWQVDRFRLTEMASRAFIPRQFMSGDHPKGEHAFIADSGGVPWMANQLINVQATARLGGIKLIQDADTEVLSGEVVKIHRLPEARRHVEARAAGMIDEIRLTSAQYEGRGDYYKIAKGDCVKLEVVRLPDGCWVGPKFILPNINYNPDKAPFQPVEHEKYTMCRSQPGDLYPTRILG